MRRKEQAGRTISLVALVAVLASLLALGLGCGGDEESMTTTAPDVGAPETTTAAAGTAPTESRQADKGFGFDSTGAPAAGEAPQTEGSGSLTVAEQSLGRKVISNASVQVEVERGKFQDAFDRAVLLADRYGGYVISSESSAAGEDDVLRSGTVAIRIPSQSFVQALAAAGNLGKLRSRQVSSQDVTEEFVDLEARLRNAEAQERALQELLAQAKTVDEILQVRQHLSAVRGEIEQLKGRLRYLEEHTSFSTITISLFETGVEVASAGGWGFLQALRDAARGFVNTLNGMIVGLGETLPVFILLGVLGWIAFRLVGRSLYRGRREGPPPPSGV